MRVPDIDNPISPMATETFASANKDADDPYVLSETWAEDAQDDLEEFIELQGIQLRF